MALFFMTALGASDPLIEDAITSQSKPEDVYKIESGKWIVSSDVATSKALSEKLGLMASTTHFVVPVRGYFGRAQPDLWEWLAAKSVKSDG